MTFASVAATGLTWLCETLMQVLIQRASTLMRQQLVVSGIVVLSPVVLGSSIPGRTPAFCVFVMQPRPREVYLRLCKIP